MAVWNFFEFLRPAGGGSRILNDDYSSVEGVFLFETPNEEIDENIAVISHMVITISDMPTFQATRYGAIVGGLTNGLSIVILDRNGNVKFDLFNGETVKSNEDWASVAFDANLESWGGGAEFLVVRYSFLQSGSPLVLDPGESIVLILQDDLSELTRHTFFVQGYYPHRCPQYLQKFLTGGGWSFPYVGR